MEEKTVQEVLKALDEFLIYRTNYKLQELVKVRNKLRQEREEYAAKTGRSHADFASATK